MPDEKLTETMHFKVTPKQKIDIIKLSKKLDVGIATLSRKLLEIGARIIKGRGRK